METYTKGRSEDYIKTINSLAYVSHLKSFVVFDKVLRILHIKSTSTTPVI